MQIKMKKTLVAVVDGRVRAFGADDFAEVDDITGAMFISTGVAEPIEEIETRIIQQTTEKAVKPRRVKHAE